MESVFFVADREFGYFNLNDDHGQKISMSQNNTTKYNININLIESKRNLNYDDSEDSDNMENPMGVKQTIKEKIIKLYNPEQIFEEIQLQTTEIEFNYFYGIEFEKNFKRVYILGENGFLEIEIKEDLNGFNYKIYHQINIGVFNRIILDNQETRLFLLSTNDQFYEWNLSSNEIFQRIKSTDDINPSQLIVLPQYKGFFSLSEKILRFQIYNPELKCYSQSTYVKSFFKEVSSFVVDKNCQFIYFVVKKHIYKFSLKNFKLKEELNENLLYNSYEAKINQIILSTDEKFIFCLTNYNLVIISIDRTNHKDPITFDLNYGYYMQIHQDGFNEELYIAYNTKDEFDCAQFYKIDLERLYEQDKYDDIEQELQSNQIYKWQSPQFFHYNFKRSKIQKFYFIKKPKWYLHKFIKNDDDKYEFKDQDQIYVHMTDNLLFVLKKYQNRIETMQIIEANPYINDTQYNNLLTSYIRFTKCGNKIFILKDKKYIQIVDFETNKLEKTYSFSNQNIIHFDLDEDDSILNVITQSFELVTVELKYSKSFFLIMNYIYKEFHNIFHPTPLLIDILYNLIDYLKNYELVNYNLFLYFASQGNHEILNYYIDQLSIRQQDSVFFSTINFIEDLNNKNQKCQVVLQKNNFLQIMQKNNVLGNTDNLTKTHVKKVLQRFFDQHNEKNNIKIENEQMHQILEKLKYPPLLNKIVDNLNYVIKKLVLEYSDDIQLSTQDFWQLLHYRNNLSREVTKFIALYMNHKLDIIENNILINENINIYAQNDIFAFFSQVNQNYKCFDIFTNHSNYNFNIDQENLNKKQENEDDLIYNSSNSKTAFMIPYQTNSGFDLRLGSQWSLMFFKMLDESNSQIHNYYKPFITYKFQQVKYKLLIIAFYYQLLLIFYVLQLIFKENPDYVDMAKIFGILTLVMALISLFLELSTGLSESLKEHLDLYNSIDLTVQVTIIVLTIITFLDIKHQAIVIAQMLTLLLLNIRTLLEFRIYRAFRFLLRIVRNVFFDLFPFIVVTVFFVFIYTCLMFNLDKFYGRETGFFLNFPTALNQGFGQYDIKPQLGGEKPYVILDWLVFVCCTFILTLLLIKHFKVINHEKIRLILRMKLV